MAPVFSRKAIFDVLSQHAQPKRLDAVTAFVIKQINPERLTEVAVSNLRVKISKVNYELELRWKKAHRIKPRFLKANESWLKEQVDFESVLDCAPDSSYSVHSTPGRPKKDFNDCNSKVQTRKIQSIIKSTTPEELSKATEVALRKSGKRDSAAIVKELCFASPTWGTSVKKARKFSNAKPAKLTANEALALQVDANLSTNQYDVIRNQARKINCSIYPSYNKLKKAKKMCYPDNITITETYAELSIKSLIDHTVRRLCTVQENVLQTCDEYNLEIDLKWGCDGASQNMYRVKFSDSNSTDESLFSLSMVPLQIYSVSSNRKKIIWQNPAPSSTRYCRPIKFIFSKETIELVKYEVSNIEEQIANLVPTIVSFGSKEFVIKPNMIFCMIDGKICNAVTGCSSTQSCYICKAKPSEMNNLAALSKKPVDENLLRFGLSPLHAWIRFLECVLHISYRLAIKAWQARGEKNKKAVEAKKKIVQERFRSELGLLIDMPKQQGGNTNDGNTARKFFRNADKSSEITGINKDLIHRFRVILECLNCGFPIDLIKFSEFTQCTLELYLRDYSWYPMPVSVHKILFHGKDIVSTCILPIGQLSEEAQEARNKDFRKYRELFTRKTSRIDTNTDLFHRLLITSDPLIASFRAPAKTKRSKIMPDVLALLNEPNIEALSDHSDTDSSCDSNL